jgi:hypothetical protein
MRRHSLPVLLTFVSFVAMSTTSYAEPIRITSGFALAGPAFDVWNFEMDGAGISLGTSDFEGSPFDVPSVAADTCFGECIPVNC